mmetsp:Transcript_13518/g.25589  ORF Transcript_13518/g.25589 Transcript_13518/m.25589 type:complete len:87 (+) Transcript_13518:67-327(+)
MAHVALSFIIRRSGTRKNPPSNKACIDELYEPREPFSRQGIFHFLKDVSEQLASSQVFLKQFLFGEFSSQLEWAPRLWWRMNNRQS